MVKVKIIPFNDLSFDCATLEIVVVGDARLRKALTVKVTLGQNEVVPFDDPMRVAVVNRASGVESRLSHGHRIATIVRRGLRPVVRGLGHIVAAGAEYAILHANMV